MKNKTKIFPRSIKSEYRPFLWIGILNLFTIVLEIVYASYHRISPFYDIVSIVFLLFEGLLLFFFFRYTSRLKKHDKFLGRFFIKTILSEYHFFKKIVWGKEYFSDNGFLEKNEAVFNKFKQNMAKTINCIRYHNSLPLQEISDIFSAMRQLKREVKRAIENQYEAKLHDTKIKQEFFDIMINEKLLPAFTITYILKDWQELVIETFSQQLKETLNELKKMDDFNKKDYELLLNTIENFKGARNKSESFRSDQNEGITHFFEHIDHIQGTFVRSIRQSASEFVKIKKLTGDLYEISENIKLLALNMSIEASKSQGNKAFSVLAREQRKLSGRAEEVIGRIHDTLKDSLEVVEKEEQEVVEGVEELGHKMNEVKSVIEAYDKNTVEINRILNEMFLQIQENNKQDRMLTMNVFKHIQNAEISKEHLDHNINLLNRFIIILNGFLEEGIISFEHEMEHFVKDEKKIKEMQRDFFNYLYDISTTTMEKQWLKELSVKYLDEEINVEETTGETFKEDDNALIEF